MKIEIDIDDVFRDGDGEPGESMEEAVRRHVVERLSKDMRERLFKRADIELTEAMRSQINAVLTEKMPSLVEDIMNATYTPVSTYGQRGEPTTFRAEIIKSIGANLKYEPRQYSSDENAFTKAVKSVVEAKTGEIKKALVAEIDGKFQKDAISFAVTELSKRLGLTK